MNLLLDVLTTAAILYIVSAGLLLIFGVMKIVNFAHGAFLTVGAYASLVSARLGLTPSYLRQSGRGMAGVQQNISYRKELYPGDTVAVRTGVLDMAAVPPSFYANVMPEADSVILSPLTAKQQRQGGAGKSSSATGWS